MDPLILIPKSIIPLLIVHGCVFVFFHGWVIRDFFIPDEARRKSLRWYRIGLAVLYLQLFIPILISWARDVRFYDPRREVANTVKRFLTDEEMGYVPDVLTDEEMGITSPPQTPTD
jgi:hypothetical protein